MKAQDFRSDIRFLEHLVELEEYDEALLAIDNYQGNYKKLSRKDTLNYFRGKIHYYQKNLVPSIRYFESVSRQSSFWIESRFLAYYQKAYNFDIMASRDGWESLQLTDQRDQAIRNFQLAGLSLLERDMEAYEKYRIGFSNEYYQLKSPQENLEKFAEGIRSFKRKSPLVAGIFSTLVPGAGKIYIGKVGEGLISFLTVGIFGLQTWEAYKKDGVESVRFILFGTALTTFYIGNIWGSVLAVKIRNDEFNDQINQSVLVTMHVPLRLLFD